MSEVRQQSRFETDGLGLDRLPHVFGDIFYVVVDGTGVKAGEPLGDLASDAP